MTQICADLTIVAARNVQLHLVDFEHLLLVVATFPWNAYICPFQSPVVLLLCQITIALFRMSIRLVMVSNAAADAGALNWRVPAGLFTWNQHERILSVLMQLFCSFHCKVVAADEHYLSGFVFLTFCCIVLIHCVYCVLFYICMITFCVFY